ncbi:MAG: Hsp20/alpha crystallin family protein [Flavipsychrobacter sp.]|nr:Hsp20/alpha crystallin family protein [Flavipsychrobacter sp.]
MNNTIIKNKDGQQASTSFSGLVDQLFDDGFKKMFDDRRWGFNGRGFSPNVPVNIHETDTSFELDVVAPGLKKEDFKIDVSNDRLTVTFEHKEETKNVGEGNNYVHQEYRHQSFSRSFNLDDTIDVNKIAAKYTDGILKLTVPKKEGAQKIARTITIE